MRVLVTGHKGYIGVILVPMLLERGHEVIGYDSDLFRACDFDGHPVEIQETVKDIRDAEVEDFGGVEAVIHLAGLSNDPLGNLDPNLTKNINHLASIKVATCAKAAGVSRFIFSSSCSNYGAGGEDWLNEESAFNPVTPYGHSKVQVEKGLDKLAGPGFCVTSLRNATAYGVSCRIRFDLVLNNLVAWAVTTGKVLIKSDGTPWRPIVHIEDISRAFISVLEADPSTVQQEAFNVGRNGDNHQVRDLADMVKEMVPGCEIEYADGAGPDLRCYRVDCSKISKVLPSFQPKWDARKGVEELYNVFSKISLTPQQFEGETYQRIAHVKHLLAKGSIGSDLTWKGVQ